MAIQPEIRIREGVPVVRCTGTIVFGEQTAELHLYLKELIADQHRLVLNLRGVRYLDSAGMGMLIGIYVSAIRDGGHLKLVGLSPKVRRVLKTARLLHLFEVFEFEEQAVQACLAPAGRAPE